MVMTVDEKKKLENMEEQLNDIDGKVDEILSALKGDTFGLNAGLSQDFKDLKSRVRKLEDLKQRMIWTAMGAGLAAGFTLDKVWLIIQKLLH
jgi:hypothetical protein